MDPVIVDCPVGQYTCVAYDLKAGAVHVVDTKASYYYTYREAGGSAPTDPNEAVYFRGRVDFPDLRGVDVYVYCKESTGRIRVDPRDRQFQFLDGSLNIHDADVHQEVFAHFVTNEPGVSTFLAEDVLQDSYSVKVGSAVGLVVGDNINVKLGSVQIHSYKKITGINGNILTLASRFDTTYPAGSIVEKTIFSFNVLGTIDSPIIYEVPLSPTDVLHITALNFAFVHAVAADDGKFAGISALQNGLHLRVKRGSGAFETMTVWRNNQDILLDVGASKIFYTDKAPGGEFGTSVEGHLKDISGAVARLDGSVGDTLQLVVQDDLTDLVDARARIIGHWEGAYE